MTAATTPGSLTLTMRRDYAPVAADTPGMTLGTTATEPDVAQRVVDLFDTGVRHVALADVVDLAGGTGPVDPVPALVLVRELTAYGIVVSWRVRLPDDPRLPMLLSHLHPPEAVIGPSFGAEIAEVWRRRFHLGKCFWRQGPGFIEVRDRRSARQVRTVIDEPVRLDVVAAMLFGVDVADVAGPGLDEFTRAGLAHRIGRRVWWTPYRIRRWPSPPLLV